MSPGVVNFCGAGQSGFFLQGGPSIHGARSPQSAHKLSPESVLCPYKVYPMLKKGGWSPQSVHNLNKIQSLKVHVVPKNDGKPWKTMENDGKRNKTMKNNGK